jgi:hypothetical protein
MWLLKILDVLLSVEHFILNQESSFESMDAYQLFSFLFAVLVLNSGPTP